MPFLTSISFCFSTVIFLRKCSANLLFFSYEISYKLFFIIAQINVLQKLLMMLFFVFLIFYLDPICIIFIYFSLSRISLYWRNVWLDIINGIFALLELATSLLEYKRLFPQGQTSNPIATKTHNDIRLTNRIAFCYMFVL